MTKTDREAGKKNSDNTVSPAGRKDKMKRKEYEKELEKLQVEMVKLQAWVKETQARIIVLFEGRDAAGKGG